MEKNSEATDNSNKRENRERLAQEALIYLITVVGSGLASAFYGRTIIETAGLVILAAVGMGAVVFSIEQGIEKETFLFDNDVHLLRFALLYLLSFCGGLLFPMLPVGGWPYLAVFIGLTIFSNQVTGISAGTVLLMITCMLYGGNGSEFFIYFIGGLIGATVFSYVNITFKVVLPLVISLMMQLVCLALQEVLFVNETLHLDMLLIPVVNLLVCTILLLILLKYFSFAVIYSKRDLYMDINDPECPLLVELKSTSKEEYYHAIHTAYLCDRIAKKLNMDDALVKACGYYHRIGILKGENSWENVQTILEENQFPQRVKEILKEYLDKSEIIRSGETVVLLFSDTIISSINYLFSKEPNIQLDYEKIIGGIFKKRMESGVIDNSDLTFGQLQEMKKILTEEKLYYDFLR